MFVFLSRRLLMMIPLIIGITLITFVVIHLAPGSPIDVQTDFNPKASPEAKERFRAYYGLDKPLHVQYLIWMKRLMTLDFGPSMSADGRPVIDKIKESLPITISINLLSLLLVLAIAIPIGIFSATHQYSWVDKATTVFVFIGFAMPTFWLALILMILFGIKLQWLPISSLYSFGFEYMSFWDKVLDLTRHLILPVSVSAFTSLAGMSRFMRGNMLEVIRQDYITTARSKGLPEYKVIYKHALRNAIMPVITILGLSLPAMIGGSVIFESIFAIPGMGRLFYTAVWTRDYNTVMGILVIGAFLTLLGNLLADISYALVDPRIRLARDRNA
jgi:peptide/nickel transport system permease protein